MDEGVRLRCDGGYYVGVRVAEKVHRDAGHEVEVLPTRVVIDETTAAAHERHGQAAAGLHEVAVGQL